MKREDVIKLAGLARFDFKNAAELARAMPALLSFANAIEARTIERCAKVCETERDYRVLALSRSTAINCAEAIRALKDEQ